jgi:serine/threonine-protein kinase
VLAAGTRIGPYEVVALLGTGGMGEVYRARDPKLKRDVAVKILPDVFAADPERLARFQREAEVLASLNHPHIAHLYGIEDGAPGEGGLRALVMELVEGETLADRIARGPLGCDEALPLALQIADALEAAHERGVIHRDLKPANIKVTPDGKAKVLDFGLAKALETGPADSMSPGASFSPTTMSPAVTMRGVILGTAAYMSPEQAKGRPTDRRTDIWAFGCVLFEMLTARRAFDGEDVAETMVSILSKEPDWSRVPADAAVIRPLMARCLQRDPRQRLQAIGEARIHLEELVRDPSGRDATAATAPSPRRAFLLTTGVAVIGAALATAGVMWAVMRPPAAERARPVRFEIIPPPSQPITPSPDRNVAISPDGQFIVYRAGALPQLFLRAIDTREARPIEGTANARAPFFSPDGQWIGFFDGTRLRKVPIAGGPPVTICNSQIPRGASWGEDDTIVFGTQDTATGLLRVSASGGEPAVLTTPDAGEGERDHAQPSWLPGGRNVLFMVLPADPAQPRQIAALDLQTGQRKMLIRGGSEPEYARSGHLLYAADGDLLAVRFDPERLEVHGNPVSMVSELSMNLSPGDYGRADYGLSRQGTLVHLEPESLDTPSTLVWVDRTGHETRTPAPPRPYTSVRLSPNDDRVAVQIQDQQQDIHIFDFTQRTLLRLAPGPSVESQPVWTADGRRIVFASRRDGPGNLYMQAADGSGAVQRLTRGPDIQRAAWIAPDGRGILGVEISPKTAGDVVWFPLDGSSDVSRRDVTPSARTPVERLVQSPGIDWQPDVSPDGRFVAYQSNESGQDEIFVRPFPNVADGVWSVSSDGGTYPAWAKNGRELFYLDPTSTVTAVPVQMSGGVLRFGNPSKLFQIARQGPYDVRRFDVAADRRFIVVKPGSDKKPPSLVVVVDWIEELRAKLPARP